MAARRFLNARARATLRRALDPATARGDDLLPVQQALGIGAVEAAKLLWDAFVASGRRAAPGSIAGRLRDSDSAGSFPYAEPFPYLPDDTAPRLDIDTIRFAGTKIPRLGLGCMRLLTKNGAVGRGKRQRARSALGVPFSPEESRHALLTAVDVCGLRYFDVARGYGPWPGFGERVLSQWLGRERGVVLASKVGYARDDDGGWRVDLDPGFLTDEIDKSAAQFDGVVPLLYLVVKSTPTTPVVNKPRDLARAMAPLVAAQRRGRVRHIAVANVSVSELDQLQQVATIAAVQNRFSLASLRRKTERAVLERCAKDKIPFVTWGIFGEGVQPRPPPPRAVAQAAAELRVSTENLTLALLRAAGPHVVPLPGPARRATLYASVEGANLQLEPARAEKLLGALS